MKRKFSDRANWRRILRRSYSCLALDGDDSITLVSLATDGTDGPTDSAGGIADGGTVSRGRAQGIDAEDHLRRHDAYPYLLATHDLLRTGPTQTNVNDLILIFVGTPPVRM